MNSQVQILQAIGIILVVVGHKCVGLIPGSFNAWFYVYAYHMALFVFISGFLFKEKYIEDVLGYIIKKIKHLVIPYYGYNLFYGLIITILLHKNIVDFGEQITLKNFFLSGWVLGDQYVFNLAMWFVLSLFCVQVIYVLMRKMISRWRINPFLFLFLLLSVGVISIIVYTKYPSETLLPFARALFLLPFFHMGHLCKTQDKVLLMSSRKAFFVFVSVAMIITVLCVLRKLGVFPNNYEYYAVYMDFNGHIFIPYFVSILGIVFWFSFSKLMENTLGKWKLVKAVSKCTWDVMAHHLFIFFLVNWFFGLIGASGFDYVSFRQDRWYTYLTPDKIFGGEFLYYVLALSIPIGIRYVIDKFRRLL